MKDTDPINFTRTPAQLKERVLEYQTYAEALKEHMPFVRSWYTVCEADKWLFGPSKFVGYASLSADEYLEQVKTENIDGRDTEGHIRQLATTQEAGTQRYNELHVALTEFLMKYGKKPNIRARVSIVNESGE